jgi:hypothetical protein
MLGIQGWEWGLLGISTFVAVSSLVALMRRHRDRLTRELLDQAEQSHRVRQQTESKNKKRRRAA